MSEVAVSPVLVAQLVSELRQATSVAASLLAEIEGPNSAREYLHELMLANGDRLPSMRDIAAGVAAKHELSVEDLKGPSRSKPIVEARQEAMWLMRQVRRDNGERRFSLPLIGQFFGGRDHTTILHGERRHADRIQARGTAA